MSKTQTHSDAPIITLQPVYSATSRDRKAATEAPARTRLHAIHGHTLGHHIYREDGNSDQGVFHWRNILVIATAACVTLFNSMLSGVLVVALPTMARDLHLPQHLLLWPASVGALASGCTLLLAGSIADVVGGKRTYLFGTLALIVTTVACGVARTGIQLIVFRAAQGVAVSFCLPSSVIIITQNISTGTLRNAAFACLGAGQPLGFSIGLVLGGYLAEGIGWRYAYYIVAILTAINFVISVIALPEPRSTPASDGLLRRLKDNVDWLGCVILSTSLGFLSYVLALLTAKASAITKPTPMAMLIIAVLLVPGFVLHVRRQKKHGAKVIIAPELWGNRIFTTLCITIFVVWGSFNAIQYFLALYYQNIQGLSATQTSLRLIPLVVAGFLTNVATGYLVKDIRADVLVLGAGVLAAIAPLLLAIMKPEWSYWQCALPATAFTPLCADVLYTVANLLITSIFPPDTHGLAGGVFNTVANIGNAVGLAITAVLASSVSSAIAHGPETSAAQKIDQLQGYRATFWLCFGATSAVLAIVPLGLRKIGKVGLKID